MRHIRLTKGYIAIVDDEDFDRLSQWKWSAKVEKCGAVYAHRPVPGTRRNLLMHRDILGLTDPLIESDHKNGNGLDNRRMNLRAASHAENARNRKIPKNNKTGAKGVTLEDGRFRAVIRYDKVKYSLGQFGTLKEAAHAYDQAAMRLHGDFARTNVVLS